MNRVSWIAVFGLVILKIQAQTPSRYEAFNTPVTYLNVLAQKVNAVSFAACDVNKFNHRTGYRSDRLMVPYSSDWTTQDEADFQHALRVATPTLRARLTTLTEAYRQLDEQTKQLEIYAKLEDYKRDQYEKAKQFPMQMDQSLARYAELHAATMAEIEKAFGNTTPATKEARAAHEIRTFLVACRQLMQRWTFNREFAIHTGWPIDDMRNLYALHGQTWKNLKALPEIPGYFIQHGYLLESFDYQISSTLNGYTDQAQTSDEYANEKLLSFQRNLTTLTNDYNQLLNSFRQTGYTGLFMDFPLLLTAARTGKVETARNVPPYEDRPYRSFTFAKQAAAIPRPVAAGLNAYADFIGAGTRLMNRMIMAANRSNGSLATTAFEIRSGKRKMRLFHSLDIDLPESEYRKAMNESTVLPVAVRQSLSDQATVLYNIFQEMYAWNSRLKLQDAPKSEVFASVDEAYQAYARIEQLVIDYERNRERLNDDLHRVFLSYAAPATGSWPTTLAKSRQLVKTCYSEVKKLREQLQHKQPLQFNNSRIDSIARLFLSGKYANLKGIPAEPGSGNDPGYRYEYLFNQVNTLNVRYGELMKKLDGDTIFYFNRDLVLAYSNLTHDEFQLGELSKLPFLKESPITGVFLVVPPVPPRKRESEDQPVAAVPKPTPPVAESKPQASPAEGRVIRDTVRVTDIIRIETRSRDTVYIEKRDTVYISNPNESIMSLDGFPPNNLVLLLDVSSSMDQPEKLPVLKMSVLTLAKLMRPEDELAIVIFSDKAAVALPPTSAREFKKIQSTIQRLRPVGNTNGNQGLLKAYEVCRANFKPKGNNRIILATDGEFTVAPATQELIRTSADQGISLSLFSFAKNANSVEGLQKLAQAGKGNFETITYSNVDAKLMTEARGQ